MQVHHQVWDFFCLFFRRERKNIFCLLLIKPFQKPPLVDFSAIKHAAGLSISRKCGCELTANKRQIKDYSK